MEFAREALAPKPLGQLPDSTMLAVASVPGKHPEEWREAWPLWMAYPHAAGAVYAVEMTAAQLRARLADMGSR
jgi:alkylhydroperoxidase family enzyme